MFIIKKKSLSDHIYPPSRHSPFAAVGRAAVVGRSAVHVRRLQLHLAGGNGGVQFHLCSMYNVKHQAYADEDLMRGTERASHRVDLLTELDDG